MLKVKAVLFDLGYTLWDVDYSNEPQAYSAARLYLIDALGGTVDVPDAQAIRDAVAAVFVREMKAWIAGRLEQTPTEEVYREAFSSLGLEVPLPVLRRMGEVALSPSIRYRVDADTPPTLRALRERGLRLGAVSNTYQSSEALERNLSGHGLAEYLDVLVVSSEVGLAKPHPAIFNEALGRLEAEAAESVFVGDIVWADILGAQALGMRAVLTHQYRREDPGESRPDLVIERLDELPAYVDHLRSE